MADEELLSTTGRQWHTDPDFWHFFGLAAFAPERDGTAEDEVNKVLASVPGLQPGSSVLDVGSGPGRHAIRLAKRGMRVTAVEPTDEFRATLASRSESENIGLDTVSSLTEICDPDTSFDLVICIGLTFGYYERDAENQHMLDLIGQLTRPGGYLILEAAAPSWPEVLGSWYVVTRPGLNALVQRDVVTESRVIERWTVREAAGDRTFTFSQRLYSAAEITAALSKAGYSAIKIYNDALGNESISPPRKLWAKAQRATEKGK
jgi:SAM-dependent methyltransferase